MQSRFSLNNLDWQKLKEDKYYLYQHVNPKNNQVFYIGSGKGDRAYQASKTTRGANYYKYCVNNKLVIERLIVPNGHNFGIGYNVVVEILNTYDNKQDALQAEYELIDAKYGIYPLINTLVGYGPFVGNYEALERRSQIVAKAVSKPCVNLYDMLQFDSLKAMAKYYNVPYCRLQKRMLRISSIGLCDVTQLNNMGLDYTDNVYPHRN